MAKKYNHAALGGTFDLLHRGHISLLEKAFTCAKSVSIGITTDKFCRQSGKTPLEDQTARKKNLLSYLKSKDWSKRAEFVWLNDVYGTTLKDKTLDAIVVSKETETGASEINKLRAKYGLKKLKVIACPRILAQDHKKISTGRIRSGEISPEGQNFSLLLQKIAGERFNNQIRASLKKPFGKIIKTYSKTNLKRPIIAVGDISTQRLLKNHIVPNVSIVDFNVDRKRVFRDLSELGFAGPNPDYVIKNMPGQISKDLIETVKKVLKDKSRKHIILVDGEEDLAFIPALLLSPIPATIFYGQPKKGQVETIVTPETKEKLCTLLQLRK